MITSLYIIKIGEGIVKIEARLSIDGLFAETIYDFLQLINFTEVLLLSWVHASVQFGEFLLKFSPIQLKLFGIWIHSGMMDRNWLWQWVFQSFLLLQLSSVLYWDLTRLFMPGLRCSLCVYSWVDQAAADVIFLGVKVSALKHWFLDSLS